jgi:hypothetical protein
MYLNLHNRLLLFPLCSARVCFECSWYRLAHISPIFIQVLLGLLYTECPKKYILPLDAYNSRINRDGIVVFCSDVLE